MSTPTTAAAPAAVTTPAVSPTPAGTPTIPGASTAAQPPKPAAPAERMLKVKIDGVEQVIPESEAIVRLQKAGAADKRMQEAAAEKKNAQQIIEWLRSNPKAAFQKLGIDVRKFSEDTLLEMINTDNMSPEQKKAAENEAELKKFRDAEKKRIDDAQKAEAAKLFKQEHDNYEKVFMEALALSGLPKSKFTMRRMAWYEAQNVAKGLSLKPEQLAKLVRDDYYAEHLDLYGKTDGEKLLELFGKDIVKKLSKAQMKQLKAAAGSTPATKTQPLAQKSSNSAAAEDSHAAFKKENRRKLLGV